MERFYYVFASILLIFTISAQADEVVTGSYNAEILSEENKQIVQNGCAVGTTHQLRSTIGS